MVKSVLEKSLPFKSYSKNSRLPSKKFLIKMSILCYKGNGLGINSGTYVKIKNFKN